MFQFSFKQFLLIVLIFVSTISYAQMTFNHVGAVESQEELDFVKEKIANKEEPWYTAYNSMLSRATATYNTKIQTSEDGQKQDALKAYANALAWHYTNNIVYADRAVKILNLWANTFTGYTTTGQDLLVAGWIGSLIGPAAELMRDYSGWSTTEKENLKTMFIEKFYPPLNTMSTWNGNVDLTQIEAMLAIAVFNEDETEFNAGIARLKLRNPAYFYDSTDENALRTYGGSSYPNSWSHSNSGGSNVSLWVDGITQETCRDNGHHAQFALAAALAAAEIAWHQNVDVYSENTVRYMSALELMAKQLRTGNMQGTCVNNVSTNDRYNTFEIGYNHYHTRMGLDLPETEQLLKGPGNNFRSPLAESSWNIFYETLTHADLDLTNYNVVAPVIITQPKNVIVANGSTSTLSVLARGQNPLSFQWKKDGIAIDNATESELLLENISNSDQGLYSVEITNTLGTTISENATVVIIEPLPFNGTPITIPGRLEVENFDIGGELITYHDTDVTNKGAATRLNESVDIEACTDSGLGYNLGYIEDGEWLTYTIDVAESMNYNLTFRFAADANGGKLNLNLDGFTLVENVTSPNTKGWQTWKNEYVMNVPLSKGIHTLQLEVITGQFNLNYIDFTDEVIETTISNKSINYIEIAPNPTYGAISILYNETEKYYVSMTTVFGQNLIGLIELNDNTIQQINDQLSQQAAGLYTINFYKEGILTGSKTIIKK